MSRRRDFRKSGSLFDSTTSLRALKNPFRIRGKDPRVPNLRIRPARPSDLSFIEGLSGKVFSKYGPYREWIRRWFESETAVTLVGLVAEKPAGYAMLGRFSDAERIILSAELLAIAVHPGKQRIGLGRMLMKEIEEIALSLGVGRLFLHTAKDNLPAQKLFRTCLFSPILVRENFYPAGQDALQMVKDLL